MFTAMGQTKVKQFDFVQLPVDQENIFQRDVAMINRRLMLMQALQGVQYRMIQSHCFGVGQQPLKTLGGGF